MQRVPMEHAAFVVAVLCAMPHSHFFVLNPYLAVLILLFSMLYLHLLATRPLFILSYPLEVCRKGLRARFLGLGVCFFIVKL